MVEFVQPADDGAFQDDAEDADDQRRQDQAGEIADPQIVSSIQATNAPIMNSAPCAKLMMLSMRR